MKSFWKNSLCFTMAGALALLPVTPSLAMTQDETVYVKLQETGETKQISVVEHLVNDSRENELADWTILKELENLNGFESFETDGENVKWQAQGEDIYYRGTTEKGLPVKLKVTYKLDGEEKSLNEILGKSGRVEIKLQYTNSSKVGNMYTPFVVAVATTLDESKVSNVNVINGKATGNGRTVAVAAVAAPGLYESLGLEELRGTDEVVISFDTKKFELGDIYSIVTPKLLDSVDLNTFTELDELYASTNKLASNSKQLVEGSNSLKNGVAELRTAVAQAKAQLNKQGSLIDNTTLAQIKAAASTQAEQQIEAQRTTIAAGVKAQVEGNQILMHALELQAQEMCNAKIGGAICPAENVKPITAQLVAAVENSMIESSMILAKTTAKQTATATAESIAKQVASAVQNGMGEAVITALDQMLVGIDKLAKGANDLSVGMAQFDREGIQALTNFVNGKVKVTTNKVKQLIKLAEDYDSYAGIAEKTEGSTKFILMIEGKK